MVGFGSDGGVDAGRQRWGCEVRLRVLYSLKSNSISANLCSVLWEGCGDDACERKLADHLISR